MQTVTFRLANSVPNELIHRWKSELSSSMRAADGRSQSLELRRRIERFADRGLGDNWLRQPEVANLVESSLRHFDPERYRLIAWCVMPNHVHAVIETGPRHALVGVIHSWKSYTANRAVKMLRISGPFWQREYWDRAIRNPGHLRAAIEYIENNPVKAGLVAQPEAWPWSSARFHRERRHLAGR